MEKTEELKFQLSNYILSSLKEETVKENIIKLLVDEIKNNIVLKKDKIFEADSYKNIKAIIKTDITKNIKAKGFKEELYTFIDKNLKTLENSNSTLDTVIPPAFINSLKVYIYNNKDEIIAVLKKFLNDEKVDKKIYTEINNVINSFNPMAARFINPSTIHSKLKNSINEFLSNSNNMIDIINMINSQIDTLTKKKISDFASSFPAEGRKSLINSVTNGIVSGILSEKFIDMAINIIEERILSQLSFMSSNEAKLSKDIYNFIYNLMNTYFDKILSSDKTKELISEFSGNIVDNILSKPLIDLI